MENVRDIEKQAVNTAEQAKNESVAVTDSDTSGTLYVHELQKPFEYCGMTYERFKFDFEKLTGNDMVAIETEMAANGEYALSPEISTSFLSRMAARAAGVGSDVLLKLPLREFGKIKNKARDFLVSMDS